MGIIRERDRIKYLPDGFTIYFSLKTLLGQIVSFSVALIKNEPDLAGMFNTGRKLGPAVCQLAHPPSDFRKYEAPRARILSASKCQMVWTPPIQPFHPRAASSTNRDNPTAKTVRSCGSKYSRMICEISSQGLRRRAEKSSK